MNRTRSARRYAVAAVLAVVGVLGLGIASASQLDVGAGSLGAGSGVVASCQPTGQPITIGFTTDTFSAGQYQATAITLRDVHADCSGLDFRIRMTGSGGAAVGPELTGTVSLDAGGTLTVAFPSIPANTISAVALVIHS